MIRYAKTLGGMTPGATTMTD